MSRLFDEKSNPSVLSETLPLVWERMLMGDHKSFEKVYRHTFPRLYQYGRRISSEDVVEETIQELFIHVWNKRNDLTKVSSPEAYLFCSFRNRLINHARRQKKQPVIPLDLLSDFRYRVSEETEVHYGDTLQQAINRLSRQQREVIYLLYFNDLSASEVAEILSLKVRTVYNTAYNAVNMLRIHLQKDALVSYLVLVSILVGCSL